MNLHTDDEKRQELRLTTQETLYLEVEAGDETRPSSIVIGSSVDVSANGVQLVIDRPLQSGNIYRACLQPATGNQRLYLSTLVIWSQALPDDEGWAIGLQVLESQGTDVQRWKEWVAQRCATDEQA
jgi:hypothetical protein